jgi:hypothetical protein
MKSVTNLLDEYIVLTIRLSDCIVSPCPALQLSPSLPVPYD